MDRRQDLFRSSRKRFANGVVVEMHCGQDGVRTVDHRANRVCLIPDLINGSHWQPGRVAFIPIGYQVHRRLRRMDEFLVFSVAIPNRFYLKAFPRWDAGKVGPIFDLEDQATAYMVMAISNLQSHETEPIEHLTGSIVERSGRWSFLPRYGDPPGRRRMERVLEYIDANLDKRVSVSELAEVMRMSPYHFTRVFKQTFGVSPYRYILARRVDRARFLMAAEGSSRSLAQIAGESGFCSHSHMSAAFRRTLGICPSRLRKTMLSLLAAAFFKQITQPGRELWILTGFVT